MNKDFLNKPISLKDINLKNIKLKDIKNKKEIIIGTLILVYIILIMCFGSHLLNKRAKMKEEYELNEKKYNLLQNTFSEEEFREKIEEINKEKEELSNKVSSVGNNIELTKVFEDFKHNSPLSWEDYDITPVDSREYADYDVYNLVVRSFSGTPKKVEEFLEYVDNYEKIVRVDIFNYEKSKTTGNIGGSFRLSFYFKKAS